MVPKNIYPSKVFFVFWCILNIMYIHIRVLTNQKEESVEKIAENKYKIKVREKAQKNMANTRVLEILNKIYNTNKIRIISGHYLPSKLISIDI